MTVVQPESTAGVVPLHHQIADAIRAQIDSGQLGPGDPVPSVRELCEQWKCAPLSARSALAVLAAEGRLSAGRGKRTRVRVPQPRTRLTMTLPQERDGRPDLASAAIRTTETAAGGPSDTTTVTHHCEVVGASPELAEEFGVAPGTELQRQWYELTDQNTGLRLACSVSYLPQAPTAATPHPLQERHQARPGSRPHPSGIEIDKAVRSITALMPSPGDRQRWGMEEGIPLLAVRTRLVDATGRVVELFDAVYPADRTELVFPEVQG